MLSVAVRFPVTEGVKVSFTVQEELAAMLPPLAHVPVFALAKFVALAPLITKYGVARTCGAVPLFVTVIVKGELVVPCVWSPNAPGDGEKERTGCVPVPVKAFEPLAVPKIFSVAVRLPEAVGVKVRITVQEPEAAIVPELVQVPPERTKSPELLPVMVKKGFARISLAVPMFETVTVNGELVVFCSCDPNAPGLGEKLIAGTAGTTPVPVRDTLSGLVDASVVKVTLAVLATALVGENTTFRVQDAAAASVDEQVFELMLNSAELAPVKVMLEMFSVAVPELVSVTA